MKEEKDWILRNEKVINAILLAMIIISGTIFFGLLILHGFGLI